MLMHDPSSPLVRLVLSVCLLPRFDDHNGGVGHLRHSLHHLGVPIFLSMLVSLVLSYSRSFIYHFHNVRHVKSYQRPSLREWIALPLYGTVLDATTYLASIYHLTFYGHQSPPESMSCREQFGDVPPCPIETRPDWDNIWNGSGFSKYEDTDTRSEDSFQTVNLL